MKDDTLVISASEFKATCLAVLRDLERRKYRRVLVTRRGRPIAELTPAAIKPPKLWGCMRGRAIVKPGVDLTAPAIEDPFDVDAGVTYR